MNRFLFDPTAGDGNIILLSKEESRHIAKSLRLRAGTEIELFDGKGTVFGAVILEVGRRVKVRLNHCLGRGDIQAKPVRVLQGMLKGKKMDTLVQKCTELGAASFHPFTSGRCQVRADKTQNNRRQERWQRITIAACKQCLRNQPLLLQETVPFAELLELDGLDSHPLRLLFWEEEKEVRLSDLPPFDQFDSVHLLLGPEGGFSKEEVQLAGAGGWKAVSLGERILRAETATLSALSIAQYLAGNI